MGLLHSRALVPGSKLKLVFHKNTELDLLRPLPCALWRQYHDIAKGLLGSSPTNTKDGRSNLSNSPTNLDNIQGPPPPSEDMRNEHGQNLALRSLSYTPMGLLALFCYLLWETSATRSCRRWCQHPAPEAQGSWGLERRHGRRQNNGPPFAANMTVCPCELQERPLPEQVGRRIPFITTLPFLCLSLIPPWLRRGDSHVPEKPHRNPGQHLPVATTIGVLGVFMVAFTFFDMFVASVIWYVFNDVVPVQLLGRFLGIFRVVGGLAGALVTTGFIFKHAETHMRDNSIVALIIDFIGHRSHVLLMKEANIRCSPRRRRTASRRLQRLQDLPQGASQASSTGRVPLHGGRRGLGERVHGFFYKDMDELGGHRQGGGDIGSREPGGHLLRRDFRSTPNRRASSCIQASSACSSRLAAGVWLFVTPPPK